MTLIVLEFEEAVALADILLEDLEGLNEQDIDINEAN